MAKILRNKARSECLLVHCRVTITHELIHWNSGRILGCIYKWQQNTLHFLLDNFAMIVPLEYINQLLQFFKNYILCWHYA